MAEKTLESNIAAEIVSDTFKANEINNELSSRYKRKVCHLDIEVEDIKRSRTDKPKFKMSNLQDEQLLGIHQRWGDLNLKCFPKKTQMSIYLGNGPDSAGPC